MTELVMEETTKAGKYRQRRITVYESMWRRGTITDKQKSAAQAFEQDFNAAGLGPRYATMQIDRVAPGHNDGDPDRVIRAKRVVSDVLFQTGLFAGRILVDIVGCGMTVNDHCRRSRWGSVGARSPAEATGGLRVALEILVRLYKF